MADKIIACNLTIEDIEKLADKVEDGKLSRIKIKNGDCEVIIEKESKMAVGAGLPLSIPNQTTVVNTEAGTITTGSAAAASGNVIKAPIVGTYYSKPSPDKEPFVALGKAVKKGDVIMIIESMKLMNEVTSEYDGVVRDILIEDGTAVEFDQPIMVIE